MTEKINLGKLRFSFMGDWNPLTVYELNDVVKYGASSFVYAYGIASAGNVPSDGGVWMPLADGVRYRGTWAANTIYLTSDMVTYGQSSYIALKANSGTTAPSADLDNWKVVMVGSDQNVAKGGDVMTGPLTLAGITTFGTEIVGRGAVYTDLHIKTQTITASMIAANKVNVDISKGACVVLDSPNAAVEVNFTGFPAAGKACYWELEVVSPGANVVTIKNAITWDGDSAPSIQPGTRTTILSFRTRTSGAKIAGATSFGSLA